MVALWSSEFTLFSFPEAMEGLPVPAPHLSPAEGGIWEKLVSVRDRKLSCVPVAGLGGILVGDGSLKGKAPPLTLHTTSPSFFPCCLRVPHSLPLTLGPVTFLQYIRCQGSRKARVCSSRPFLRAPVHELHLTHHKSTCLSFSQQVTLTNQSPSSLPWSYASQFPRDRGRRAYFFS